MEDELGQGSGSDVSESPLSDDLHSETFVENNMVSENQVEDSYEEGDDDGGEIMVEIVGSDVFVDGVSGKVEADFGSAEIGDMDGLVPEKKEKEFEPAIISEPMEVSSEGGENKVGESELVLPESRDEIYIVVDEKKTGDNALRLTESGDEKKLDVTKAMDVSNEDGENEMGEKEFGLPESGSEKSIIVSEAMDVLGVVAENRTVGNEVGLPDSNDKKNYVIMEAMDVLSEGGTDKMRGSELGLSKSRDEKKLVAREVMDISSERGESKKDSELRLSESRKEKNYIVTEAMYVLSEGGENKNGESELGLSESKIKINHVVSEETEESFSGPMQCEEAIAMTQMVISEGKIVKDEADDGKTDITENDEVLQLSHGTSTDLHDCQTVPSEVVLNPNGDGQISSVESEEAIFTVATQMVNSDEKTVKDEAVDEKAGITEEDEILPLSDDALNEIVPSDVINPKGPETVQVDRIDSVVEEVDIVDASVGGKIMDTDTLKGGDCDEEANFVDEKDFAAENIDLVVKSDDALAFDVLNENEDCVNDSHCTMFESNHENKGEGVIHEEFDLVPEFKDGETNINSPYLSCVGNDEVLETNMGCQNRVVSNEQTQLADGCDSDAMNENKSLDFDIQADTKENQPTQLEVVDGGELSGNVEENVSEKSMQSLEWQKNVEIPNNIQKFGLPQNQEQEVSMIITETSDNAIEELECTNSMPSEIISVAAVSDITQVSILPEIAERSELPFKNNDISLLDVGEIDEKKTKSREENRESNGNYHDAMEVDSELGNKQLFCEADKLNLSNEERLKKYVSSLKMNQPGYFSPPETEGHFAVSDLVWGKVRSHPWWPGQIFDPSDASEKALKYYKKDSYLVAYFGDRTFAWNESSLLKPLRSHFSQIEKQSNSEGFQNAVVSALEEVSRRVEFGLACSCISKDIYATCEVQIMENTGVREESCKRYGVDHSTRASNFEPDKLIEYVRELAPRASCGHDRLDLVIAQAQLSAFYRFKGYRPSTMFSLPGELLEVDAETTSNDEIIASHKRKHILNNSSESKKERSLTELMGSGEYDNTKYESSGKKQKTVDPLTDGYDKRVSIYAAKVSNLTSQTPNKPSFKIGECIRRVASQLTGSTSSGNEEMVIDGSQKMYEHSDRSMILPIEYFPVEEMLLQLERVAQEPKKRHNFIKVVHAFFMGFRSSITLNKRGRKKRVEQTTAGRPVEEFDFDDVSDSYWTDRIVHNYSTEQTLSNHVNGPGTFQLVPFGSEKPVKSVRKTNSRKRFSDQIAAGGLDEPVKQRKQESSPAELILNFAERKSIPSEINLNKMFRRFGPLMESETEVDHESGSAKVIFKRGSDAEVARNSSEKFNIFGPVLVNYQIGYEPLVSVKVLPLAMHAPVEDMILKQ